MNTFVFARVLHVLAIVFWIGGVAMVTMVILPYLKSAEKVSLRRMVVFRSIEKRFSFPVKISLFITLLSGLYMMEALNYWNVFFEPENWWLQSMAWLWIVFAIILFVVEPFLLKRIIGPPMRQNSERIFRLIMVAHWFLLILSTMVIGSAVAGSHGWI